MRALFLFALGLFTLAVRAEPPVESIIRDFHDASSRKVLVVAHRADWRNFPENSLPAIHSAIEMGVDIIEIDVRRTRDGVLVLMHDDTLDRTTTGKGLVADHTWAELRELRLRDGLNVPTPHRIPTLEEALLAVKGRVMVNLDRCYEYFAEAMALLEQTDTVDHAIFKTDLPLSEVKAENGPFLDRVVFMPKLALDRPESRELLREYLTGMRPVAFELSLPAESPDFSGIIDEIRRADARIWVNSLWPHHNAGHDDERAVTDPDAAYGWFLEHGINIIQTDRPARLLSFLSSRERRP